jgi:hypothetical protein
MIVVNIYKAKAIGHDMRRTARAEEFKPHDEAIMKQIPGVDVQAVEAARQAIREKYAAMQIAIDSANSPEEIKAVINV